MSLLWRFFQRSIWGGWDVRILLLPNARKKRRNKKISLGKDCCKEDDKIVTKGGLGNRRFPIYIWTKNINPFTVGWFSCITKKQGRFWCDAKIYF
jgi:hypothetical protein